MKTIVVGIMVLAISVVALSACSESVPEIENSSTDYEINLQFSGSGFNKSRQRVFIEAAQQWMRVIESDLADIPVKEGRLPAGKSVCGFDTPSFTGTIDDLLIFAAIEPIDGVDKILGEARATYARDNDAGLSVVGCMRFDSADVETLEKDGTFPQVILHEMGHVLGFGTIWERSPGDTLLDTPCFEVGGAEAGFAGSKSVIEFGILGGVGNPPVENEYGKGTYCSHWDEGFFDNELMTGFLGGKTSSTVTPMSALTLASLEDIGYEVNQAEAEPYTLPSCSPTCDSGRSRLLTTPEETWEVILQPKGTLDAQGNVSLFSPRE
ncbi:MAG: leishmanolysin-related zinc metalloendopeptidase [Trueperaceae bacterium]